MISIDKMSLKQREHLNIHNVPIKTSVEKQMKEIKVTK